MSENSKIEWTDHTFNPWIGCTKVSPGCAHCYAETRDKRHLIEKVDHWGKGAPRYRTSASGWKQVLKWNSILDSPSSILAPRPRVFPSQCDWLDDEVPIEWLADFLDLIRRTPNLDWQLLTKRPKNFRKRLTEAFEWMIDRNEAGPWSFETEEWTRRWLNDAPRKNVWLGVSVEDQTRAEERIPLLLKTPTVVRFLSCEPLLGRVDIAMWLIPDECGCGGYDPAFKNCVDWVIVGGESGPKARPCNVQWIRGIVAQCKAASVPVFVKQLGAKVWLDDTPDHAHGSLLHPKGGDWTEWPEDLRIREFAKASVLSAASSSAP